MADSTIFEQRLREYRFITTQIREVNMEFHLAERHYLSSLVPEATRQALKERSDRLDALQQREQDLRRALMELAEEAHV